MNVIEGWYLDPCELTIRPVTALEDYDDQWKFSWLVSGRRRGYLSVGTAVVSKRDVFATSQLAINQLVKKLELDRFIVEERS